MLPKSWTQIQPSGCFSWRSTTRNLSNQLVKDYFLGAGGFKAFSAKLSVSTG
jgi:hypothetical protein